MTTDPDRIAALTAQNEALRRTLENCGRYFAEHDRDEEDAAMLDEVRAALSLPAPSPSKVAALVPLEPTDAMIAAGVAAIKTHSGTRVWGSDLAAGYRAMVAAARAVRGNEPATSTEPSA